MLDLEAMILDRVEYDTNGGCWLWTGPLANGYGNLYAMGKTFRVHRTSHELFIGPIPDGMFVCHKCDTPSCVNPNHLWAGTEKENRQDMYRKNRQKRWNGERAGSANQYAKLTEDQVLAIRSSKDSDYAQARTYGVGRSTIQDIRTRKTWTHI